MSISLQKPLIRHIKGANIIINNVWMFTVMICYDHLKKRLFIAMNVVKPFINYETSTFEISYVVLVNFTSLKSEVFD